ncbi:TetR/AcrR family transcriptional regulator, partial [bacterium M00.F.Ca.ET.141.01.1.1]
DGPAVLGRAAMDEIDNRHGNRSLREGLVAAMRAQAMTRLPAEALTALLAAAFDRAALAIEAGASAEDYRAVLIALMDGLSPAPPPSTRPAPSR